jgi:hypothetical protein
VLATTGGTDCILCQVTIVRPGKLFTASESIFARQVGRLTPAAHAAVVEGVVTVLRAALK